MSESVDNAVENAAEESVNEVEGRDATEPSKDEQLGDAGKKALEAEREARKKADREISELRSRLETFEDAQRTDEEKRSRELEKLREKAASEEKRAAELERRLIASRVAREVGLPSEMEERLRGTSEDEIKADAEKLREVIGGKRQGWPHVMEAGGSHESPASTSALFGAAFSRAFDNA